MRKLNSVAAVVAHCEHVEATMSAADASHAFNEVYVESDLTEKLRAMDPFSREYFDLCMILYREISGVNDYDPWVNERTPHIVASTSVTSPMPYLYGDSVTVADFILAWGWIFKNLEVKRGAAILEYGAGEGQLAVQLARMGCDVAIVDIDETYLAAVKAQCDSLGLAMELVRGEFGDSVRDRKFDRIMFFEAFHHAFNHPEVLQKIKPMLADAGFIMFSGEPVVEADSVLVPFAWGPRLDGISIRAMHMFGWCELGFQRPYFIERLMRSGFMVKYSPCAATGRGNCFMASATPFDKPINIAGYALEAYGVEDGWHESETAFRWTKDFAVFTLPDERPAAVTVSLLNAIPVRKNVTLRCGSAVVEVSLEPGQTYELKVEAKGRRVEIIAATTKPNDLNPESTDARALGVVVSAITLHR